MAPAVVLREELERHIGKPRAQVRAREQQIHPGAGQWPVEVKLQSAIAVLPSPRFETEAAVRPSQPGPGKLDFGCAAAGVRNADYRPEERSVGKEVVSTLRFWFSPYP